MTVRTVSPDEYYGALTSRCVYGSREFVEVTRTGAEAVRYLLAYDESYRPRLGIVVGYRDGEWYAPYSAPFAEIAYAKCQQLERIYDFISELTAFLGAPLHVSLAPSYYDPEMLPKLTGVLANYASRCVLDYDYYYPLERTTRYIDYLDTAARKNLKRALGTGFRFDRTDDVDRAYSVIKANREAHRYPLAMSLEQVKATVAVVKADFFVLSLDGADVAAAMVYHVADGIAQVIYWGDAPGYAELRPMNILPHLLFEHYARQGLKIVDVGPSSTNGIPNSGLCRFKESIGCMTALKPTLVF